MKGPGVIGVAIAQLNMTVWDIRGNIAKIRAAYDAATASGSDLMITPELAVVGYMAEDLLLGDSWREQQEQVLQELAEITDGRTTGLLVGLPVDCGSNDDISPKFRQPQLYNAAILFANGKEIGRAYKHHLPNYGVFDETRYFQNTHLSDLASIEFAGRRLGVMICEDMWYDDVPDRLVSTGADIFVVLNASPYEEKKRARRLNIAQGIAQKHNKPLVYANLIGGQDELLFDGASFVLSSKGTIVSSTDPWQENVLFVEISSEEGQRSQVKIPAQDEGDIYQALMLGLRDYVHKNGFASVMLGLSGGMDSSFVSVLAADALGSEALSVVMLPSKYTSQESYKDAMELINKLGCKHYTLSIKQLHEIAAGELTNGLGVGIASLTEENLQARLRGLLLMAASNQNGQLLLATGNKSEYAVGYATIYGDMCGGFAPIKDVYKTLVYRLAHWRNHNIPPASLTNALVQPFTDNVLKKAPTAELRPNQKDQDSLPAYEVLDLILAYLIEGNVSSSQLVEQGIANELILRIRQMLHSAEFKRRQAALGPKITTRNFGKDWRYPITEYKKKG
ncbi:MAG: NAD+ synthase [Proteobacteria bacterium]|nr:NAD+ synthase [Pseudomonadota bacterium]